MQYLTSQCQDWDPTVSNEIALARFYFRAARTLRCPFGNESMNHSTCPRMSHIVDNIPLDKAHNTDDIQASRGVTDHHQLGTC